jgi:pimeloyl-[acyl-carrier protein] methyl ester esterase
MDGTGDLYTRLTEALPKSWRTTTVRYPAKTPADFEQLLAIVRENAPTGPFLLVAESYSAPLAIRFAAMQPDQLIGVVLCAGFASSPIHGWRRVMAKLARHTVFHLPIPDFAIDRFLIGSNSPDLLRRDVRKALSLVKARVLSSRLGDLLDCDVRAELKTIAIPILYIQATEDRLISGACLEEILHVNPRIQAERISGPHLLFQREPQQSAEVIERFVRALL